MIFLGIYSAFVLCYLLIAGLIYFNLPIKNKGTNRFEPTVSVIVPCRNEAQNLKACLNSIIEIDYPKDKLKVFFIDDNSNDNSAYIIEQYVQKVPFIKYLKLDKNRKKKPGKAGAVLFGIEQSVGDVLFLTDADCIVNKKWIKDLLSYFDQSVGIVGGYTLLGDPKKLSLFGKIQACDWLFLLSVASSASFLNKPISWVGNNIAFRREAYENVGGFEKWGNSLVEDFALINAIRRNTKWKSRFVMSSENLVQSQPAEPIREYYNQRKRWASGIALVRPFGLWILITCFLTNLLSIFSFFMLKLHLIFLFLFLLFCANWLIMKRAAKKLKYKITPYFLLFEIYFYLYTILLPVFLVFDRRVKWKGIDYKNLVNSFKSHDTA